MNKRIVALFLLLLILLTVLVGCKKKAPDPAESLVSLSEEESLASQSNEETLASIAEDSEVSKPQESEPESSAAPPSSSEEPVSFPSFKTVDEDGEYTSPEEVALYINTYRKLPSNFITKDAARALGWDNSLGNLQKVAPGKSIGGDRFGNYEGLLPKGKYFECDVNYRGGYRGAERLIYKTDGTVYYTKDHYESFQQLY